MIKAKLAFVLLIALLVSCQKKEIKTLQVNPDYLACDSFWHIDTLTHNDIYSADTVSYHEFYSAKEYNLNDIENIDDKRYVSRKDSVLTFKLSNGKTKKLIDLNSQHKNYFYIREIPDINCWLVQGFHNEEHQYNFLINKNTGIETSIVTLPIISPNKKHIVSFRTSCTDEPLLSFFRVCNDSVQKLWVKIFKWDIVPCDVRWKNDTTLYIKMDSICMKEHNPKYIELPVGRYMK